MIAPIPIQVDPEVDVTQEIIDMIEREARRIRSVAESTYMQGPENEGRRHRHEMRARAYEVFVEELQS